MEFVHVPVLLDQCIEGLNIKEDGIYMDATVGGAGHSSEIVKRLSTGKLIAIDKDTDALSAAKARLNKYLDKVIFVHNDYKNFAEELDKLHIDKLDGILVDLGISSYQVDNGERGFSYMQDAPLDMRMNREQTLSAKTVVNEYSVQDLTRILFQYGEEKFAKKIAEKIVSERERASIETTSRLASIVESSYPTAVRWKFGNPSKRTFQAIRIEVNSELDGLKDALHDMALRLNKGGRMAVISFHSLEDRIVKETFKDLSTGCTCPPSFPKCVCGRVEQVKLINKKPIIADEEELKNNSRAASAKLRVIERL